MKRFILVPILLGSIILSGCWQQQWLSEDELFEKKQECASYENKMKEQLKTFSFNYTSCFVVNQLFYSPIKNSCLYISSIKWWCLTPEYDIEWEEKILVLVDYFTKEILSSTIDLEYNDESKLSDCFYKYIYNTETEDEAKKWQIEYLNCMKINFDNKLKELKWE
jgi:hypothetical protein